MPPIPITSPRSRRWRPRAGLGPRRHSAHSGALGHGLTLVGFGVPILLSKAYLPEAAQRGAETAVGALIIVIAVRLMLRSRRQAGARRDAVRSPRAAFGIGLVHGVGGSAGVGVLLVATVPSTALALVSLVVLAAFSAVSMTLVTKGLGATLSRHAVALPTVAPVLGVSSLAFGVWYAAAVRSYPFAGTQRFQRPQMRA